MADMKMHNLTVNLYINAWLDCSNPFIAIYNKNNDELMAHFNAGELSEVIEQGDITLEELRSTDTIQQLETISTLLAKKAKETIREQISVLRFNRRDKENITSLFPNLFHSFAAAQ